MKFKPNKLQDVITYIVDNRGKTPPLAEEGFDLIEINAVLVGSKFPRYELIKKLVSEDTYNTWFRTGHPLKGDILISTVGAIGNVAIIREDRGCIAQNLIALRPNREIVNPDYLYYFLAWDKTRQCLRNLDIGVAQPSIKVPHLLSYIDIYTPPLPNQRKIAAILSAYDDLIENNLRRIKILEEMAQNLYTEWFVKFHFPGYEKVKMVDSPLGRIPEGWEITKLFDAAEVTYGFPFNSRLFTQEPIGKPVIRIRDILNGTSKTYTSENTKDKYIVSNGDILIGMDGKFHMCKWANGEAMLNQRVVRLRPKIELSTYYLFLSMKEPIEYFENTIVGTTVAHLSDEDLRSIEILIPNEMVSKSANDLLNDIFNEEIKLKQVNLNLHSTRDLTLPRLISGELDISDLDINTGDD